MAQGMRLVVFRPCDRFPSSAFPGFFPFPGFFLSRACPFSRIYSFSRACPGINRPGSSLAPPVPRLLLNAWVGPGINPGKGVFFWRPSNEKTRETRFNPLNRMKASPPQGFFAVKGAQRRFAGPPLTAKNP